MKIHLDCFLQCCGAGATRNRIILVEPEPQRDAAPAPNLVFTINGLPKMSQTATVYYFFPIHFHNKLEHKKI
jgi:hypothetical protein